VGTSQGAQSSVGGGGIALNFVGGGGADAITIAAVRILTLCVRNVHPTGDDNSSDEEDGDEASDNDSDDSDDDEENDGDQKGSKMQKVPVYEQMERHRRWFSLQTELGRNGGAALVLDVVMMASTSDALVDEALRFGVGLLECGNKAVQVRGC
jgi:hypothetical protein